MVSVLRAKRRKLGKGAARVTAAVGWLVPKPFTPLQWMAQPRVAYFHEVRRELLRSARRTRSAVHLQFHNPERSVPEAVFARGDRRLGPLIYEAWKRGARFDAWDETSDNRIWLDAYEATGIDPDFYAHRERRFGELLPWDHIALHLKRGYLEKSYADVLDKINIGKPSRNAGTSLPVTARRRPEP